MVVLYGCETLTLRKGHGLMAFEGSMLREILHQEVRGEWRNSHNLYSSPNIIRMIKSRKVKLAGHVAVEQIMDTKFWM
jgi:hypothetical protein